MGELGISRPSVDCQPPALIYLLYLAQQNLQEEFYSPPPHLLILVSWEFHSRKLSIFPQNYQSAFSIG